MTSRVLLASTRPESEMNGDFNSWRRGIVDYYLTSCPGFISRLSLQLHLFELSVVNVLNA